mgnify:FL=1|jgi:uncharacterized LabA/DUF88 family protein
MESSDAKINIAYIDAANLDRAIRDLHWKLDYKKFRIWLADKYKVERAYIFIGLIPKYKDLYTYFQECGFTLVFKEVVYQGSGVPKGNCDTDLIMQAIDDAYEGRLEKALLVSSDGDYAPLVKKLQVRNQFLGILSPAPAKKCSILLKRTNAPIAYINDQKKLLQIK